MVKGFTTHGPSALARQRLTDWYEGQPGEGRRRTLEALLRAKLAGLICLYLTTCFMLVLSVWTMYDLWGWFLWSSAVAVWFAVTVSTLPVYWQLRQAKERTPDKAWKVVSSRQLTYLALFQMALFCGGVLALWARHQCLPCYGRLG